MRSCERSRRSPRIFGLMARVCRRETRQRRCSSRGRGRGGAPIPRSGAMNVFLDALSDAWSQMTGTLAYVAQAFGENWRTGLAALLDRPAALFYVVGVVAVLALALSGLTAENRVGYRARPVPERQREDFSADARCGARPQLSRVRASAVGRAREPCRQRQRPPSPPGPQRRHGEERRLRDLRRPHSRSGRRDRSR